MPKLIRAFNKKSASVELVYFNIPGLGEPIRFLLAYLGVPFTDTRFGDRSEFIARKPLLKYGQVPVLIVNGVEIFQSSTIARFIAQKFDSSGTLYPSSPWLAAEVDGIVDRESSGISNSPHK